MPRHGVRPTVDFTGVESATKQSFKNEVDINTILRRYDRDGVLTHIRQAKPLYIDVSDMPDYKTALDTLSQVSENFMGLPSQLRAEFENDPAQWMDFITQNPREVVRERVEGLLRANNLTGDRTPRETPPEASESPPEPSEGD